MAAVVEESALATPLGHRRAAQLLQPAWKRRRPAERVDDKRRVDCSAVVRPHAGNTDAAVPRFSLAEEADDPCVRLQLDVVFRLGGFPERVLEHRPAGTDRNQFLVLRPHLSRQQFVLTVLRCAKAEHVLQ